MPRNRESGGWERVVCVLTAIGIILLIGFLAVRNEPFRDPNLVVLVRIILSLAAGIIGGTWTGFIRLEWNVKGVLIRAGGAFALCLVTYFFSPTVLPSSAPDAELKKAYEELQRKSEATEAAIGRFRIEVEAVKASADTAARLTDNPELKRMGHELGIATDEFDGKYHSQLTSEMAKEVRLARARAAIAEGRFRDAEALITDADLEEQTSSFISRF